MVKKIILGSAAGRKRSLGLAIGDETLTTHGGLAAIQASLDTLSVRARLDTSLGHLDGTVYAASDVFSVLLGSKIVGDCRMSNIRRFGSDDAVKHILDVPQPPHPTTASRMLERMDESDLLTLQDAWAKLLREEILAGRDSVVVDIDATPLLQWGKQEGIAKGYCPQRRGGRTYNANLAFDAKSGLPLHGALRPGNRNSLGPTGEFEDFLDFLFGKVLLTTKKVLVRADSGYYAGRHLSYLERLGVDYVISARGQVFPKLKPQDISWSKPHRGIQYGEFYYQSAKGTTRRYAIKRDRTRASQLRLDGLWDTDVVIVTNKAGRPKSIVRFYNARGTAEQYIAEGKQEFAFAKLPSRKYLVNRIDFCLKLMAMGLLIHFRDTVLPEPLRRHRPGTIRSLFVNVAAKLIRTGGQTFLRLTKAVRHARAWDRIIETFARPPTPIRFSAPSG